MDDEPLGDVLDEVFDPLLLSVLKLAGLLVPFVVAGLVEVPLALEMAVELGDEALVTVCELTTALEDVGDEAGELTGEFILTGTAVVVAAVLAESLLLKLTTFVGEGELASTVAVADAGESARLPLEVLLVTS